jgi:uncharacterized protein
MRLKQFPQKSDSNRNRAGKKTGTVFLWAVSVFPERVLTKRYTTDIIKDCSAEVNGMILDLKKIFTEKTGTVSFDYDMDLSSTEVDNVHPFVTPVKVQGSVTAKDGFALLTAETSFDFSVPCDRCTKQIDRHLHYSFTHTLVRSLENEDDDRFIEVPDGQLDLDELMREDILLELPSKFLCKEDCKGICPKCGKNLNDGPCGCEPQNTDSRFEVLKNLIH